MCWLLVVQEAMKLRQGGAEGLPAEMQRGGSGGEDGTGTGHGGQHGAHGGGHQSHYKTRLCIKYMQVRGTRPCRLAAGQCMQQRRDAPAAPPAQAAAGAAHLLAPTAPPLPRQTGYCHKAGACTFAHGYEDLRQPGAPLSPGRMQVRLDPG